MADVWLAVMKPANTVAATDLGQKVTELAQAITTFKEELNHGAATIALNSWPDREAATANLAVSSNVRDIVSILSHIDAHGALLEHRFAVAATPLSVATEASSWDLDALEPLKNGTLAAT